MSTSVQSRVKAFESLTSSSASTSSTAMHDPHDHTTPKLPYTPRRRKSPSPSPPNLGLKTSLIDLKDWVVDDGSPPRTNGFHAKNGKTPTKGSFTTPLINLDPDSPPKASVKAPPLPPRKPSTGNLKSASSTSLPAVKTLPPTLAARRSDSLTVEHTYPPSLKLDLTRPGHAPANSVSSFHSVSLSSDTDPSTPGSVSNFIATYPVDHDDDAISLDESFENVSTTSLGSPTKLTYELPSKSSMPPKLPQRPPPRSTSTSASSSTSSRRAPPPPPPAAAAERSSASDRSSVLSTFSTLSSVSDTTATSFTSISTHNPSSRSVKSPPLRNPTFSLPKLTFSNGSLPTTRPTPIPAAVRPRYETAFDTAVIQKRQAQLLRNRQWEKEGRPSLLSPGVASPKRTRPGWRGLSIDLITGGDDLTGSNDDPTKGKGPDGDDLDVDTHVGPTERLEGYIVKIIWSRSKLPKQKLGAIWNECDPATKGSLDRESFCKGMWRIDEELRRSQMGISRAPSSAASTSSIASSWTAIGRTPIRTNMVPRDVFR
ncbi:hypothetical protein K435DRAFT_874711 [Dendrothele bispora CBS 962.96]|uniref:EH domain-containing protein n=1 Tax=Dendrothele bispora (strain CBS 962.96) TaxID=1314807 RepID=A0A4S8KWC8_DENBC|nr:hypothetical protein K435DRAFT_874711 [Dendrothele bispora CBS 962.96]